MDAPAARPSPTYETDAYGWAVEQAALLRARSANAIDWDNVAEEIESVGRSERKELESRLEVLAEHLIKLAISEDDQPRAGWWETVIEQRDRAAKVLTENPSLRPGAPDLWDGTWRFAVQSARRGLFRSEERALVPAQPFLTFEQAMAFDTDEALRSALPR